MSAQTNPLVSILSVASSQLKSQESVQGTTNTYLESLYSEAAAAVSTATSLLATNPSASQIYASIASQYSSLLLTSTAKATSARASASSALSSAVQSISSAASSAASGSRATSVRTTATATTTAGSVSSTHNAASSSTGLSTGAKVGLGLGLVLGILILISLVVIIFMMMRKHKKSNPVQPVESNTQQIIPPATYYQSDFTPPKLGPGPSTDQWSYNHQHGRPEVIPLYPQQPYNSQTPQTCQAYQPYAKAEMVATESTFTPSDPVPSYHPPVTSPSNYPPPINPPYPTSQPPQHSMPQMSATIGSPTELPSAHHVYELDSGHRH